MASAETPIVVCLIGITGEGKSTTGNMLCQDASAFKTSRGMRSMTSTCSFTDFECNSLFYRVIDTPGLQDTNLSPEELHNRFRKFADLSPNGVDAFLFVVKRGRFRPEYAQAFKAFEEACSNEVLKHTILLFTCLDDETDTEFRDSLESEDIPSLQQCLRKVSGRVIGVENKVGGKQRQLEDRVLVLSCVEAIRDLNKTPFNNQHLQEASKWRIALEIKAKELELAINQQTVLQLLQDVFYGRCERAEVSKKLSALVRSEAQFKARGVVDAMAVMGQVKEVCERLIFESNQLPGRCCKEISIPVSRFCSGHRECRTKGYNNCGSNHPSNCRLYPRHTSYEQVAARQNCTSDRVGSLKQSLLAEASALKATASKDAMLHELQCLTPSATYEKLAADMLSRHKRISALSATLAARCPERLTFHIVLKFQETLVEICNNQFCTESSRIEAANSRIAEFAKHLEKLATESKEEAACVIQAAFRGQVARRMVAKLRMSLAQKFFSDRHEAVTQQDATMEEDAAQEDGFKKWDASKESGQAAAGESQIACPQGRKRPTRRGGMNKRLQETFTCDNISIPATDDGFD